MKKTIAVAVLATVLLVSIVGTVAAQVTVDRPRVLVLPVANATAREQNEVIAQTVTDTMVLTLRLLGSYELRSAEMMTSTEAIGRSVDELDSIAARFNVDNVIFGSVNIGAGNTLLFSVSVFDRAAGRITLETQARAASLFDIFDAADELVTEAISGFSGVRIGFGSLRIHADGEGDYRLYLDGNLVGDNVSSLDRVLIGPRALEIRQPRGNVEAVIHRETVDLVEGQSRTVAFTFPLVTEEERLREEALRGRVIRQLNAGIDPLDTARVIDDLEELYRALPAGYPGGLEEIPFYRDRLELSREMQRLVTFDLRPPAEDTGPAGGPQLIREYRNSWDELYVQYRTVEREWLNAQRDGTVEDDPPEDYRYSPRQRLATIQSDVDRNLTVLSALITLERASVVDRDDAYLVSGYNDLLNGVHRTPAAPTRTRYTWPQESIRARTAMQEYRWADSRRRPLWHVIAGSVGLGALGYAAYVQYAGVINEKENEIERLIPIYEASTDFDEIVSLRSRIRNTEDDLFALETTRTIAAGVGATLVAGAVIGRIVSLTRPSRIWRRYRNDPFLDRWTAAGLEYRSRAREAGEEPTLLVLGMDESFSVTGVTGNLTTPQVLRVSDTTAGAWTIEHLTAGAGRQREYRIPLQEGMQIVYLGIEQ